MDSTEQSNRNKLEWEIVTEIIPFSDFPTTTSDGPCTICLDRDESCVETPCRHVFGSDCLRTWMKRSPTCPMCRQTLPYLLRVVARLTMPPICAMRLPGLCCETTSAHLLLHCGHSYHGKCLQDASTIAGYEMPALTAGAWVRCEICRRDSVVVAKNE